MFTLYTTPLSANGRKPLVVSSHLGLEPDIELVDVYRGEGRMPEYLAINPWGKIPTLVDGAYTLWESNAIMQYITDAYGERRLWSRDPKRRAAIACWLFWESSHWQPAFVPVLTDFVAHLLQTRKVDSNPPPVQWHDKQLETLLMYLDKHLGDREFLVDDELSLADISVAAMLMYVRPAGFPFDVFANIGSWYARIEALEAWQSTAVEPWHT